MLNNSLSFLTSYFPIIPAIAILPLHYQLNALTFPVALQALLTNHVEALIKDSRDQTKMLRGGDEREARATDVVAVRPFGDAEESLLAGGAEV